jgi:hypothetical protein
MRKDPQDVILYPPPKEGAPYVILIDLGDGKRAWKVVETEEEAKREIASIPEQVFRVPPFDEDRR